MKNKVISTTNITTQEPTKQELKKAILILKHISRTYTDDIVGYCLEPKAKMLSKKAMDSLKSNKIMTADGKFIKNIHETLLKLISFPYENSHFKTIFYESLKGNNPLFIVYRDRLCNYALMEEFISINIDLLKPESPKFLLESINSHSKLTLPLKNIHSMYLLPLDW